MPIVASAYSFIYGFRIIGLKQMRNSESGGDEKKRRVLIVVSAFYPAMLADMQRARMLAWELPKLGWEVEVLTPGAGEIRQDVVEPDGAAFFPPEMRVHEVGSVFRRLFEAVGSRTHSWRTLWPIYRKGRELLASRRFDLVYFSTTTWVYFALGLKWQRKFKVPYVLDYHDPWIKERPKAGTDRRSWKSLASERLMSWLERSAVLNATGIVSVSPAYLRALRERYEKYGPDWLGDGRSAVIPFGALERDLSEVRQSLPTADDEEQGLCRIVYVGAGGPIMARSFGLICSMLATLRAQGHPLVERVRIELFGTHYGWQAGDRKYLEDIAGEAGLSDLVKESPGRVSYRRSLELLLQSHGALILGVDDDGYMPSKLFSYALSGRPLLMALHLDSPAYALSRRIPGLGLVLWFDAQGEVPAADGACEAAAFLEEVFTFKNTDRLAAVKPFLAPAMTESHVKLFEACLMPPVPVGAWMQMDGQVNNGTQGNSS